MAEEDAFLHDIAVQVLTESWVVSGYFFVDGVQAVLLHLFAALGDGLQLPDFGFRQPLLLLEEVYYGLHRLEELD